MNQHRLLTERDFRDLLGGMSERAFKGLRASGVIGAPLALGPRTPRWTLQDYEETVARLPRRPERSPEPEQLRCGRAERLERQTRGG